MLEITRTEKEKYIADFSEDVFREKVVRRLLMSLGYKDGRDTCGPEEFGKDALFLETDKLGVDNFTAVQTKKGNINLSGDPSANLHSVIAQLRTALNQPHVCTHTKKKILPLTVYLIASGKINQAARNYIVEQIQDPRLRFLDRDDIISKIDDFCPELWGGIVADVSPYLRAMARRVEDLSIISDTNPVNSSVGGFAAASDQRFVDVRLSHQVLKVERRAGKISEEIEYQEVNGTALFAKQDVRALIIGDAGSGKSTLLIRLAYLIAKQSSVSTKNYLVPIFCRARELIGRATESQYSTLESIVLKLPEVARSPFTIEDLEDGRIVLLIDGLDELANTDERTAALEFATTFMDKYPRCSIAISTRPYSSIDKLPGLNRFKRHRISPLSMREADNILKGLDSSSKNVGSDWRKEILRKLEGVHGIELNPLLVTVFAISSGFERRDIPANITELFSKFTELMLGRWDEKKGFSQQYQSKVKDHLISEFAFNLHLAGENFFSRTDFVNFARDKLEKMNLSADLPVIVHEIIERSGLIRGYDELQFKHHLIQEYFASRGIPNLRFVKSIVNEDWWRNPVVFYFGAHPDAVDDLLETATEKSTIETDSFITVGLALQACYLSGLDERMEVWKWVIEAAAKTIPKKGTDSEKYPLSRFVGRYLEGRDAVALIGMEKDASGGRAFAFAQDLEPSAAELRRFWYLAGLVELGELAQVAEIIQAHPFEDERLSTGIHLGCFFASSVRVLNSEQKLIATNICKILSPRVQSARVQIGLEFKGQLLEFRRGGVVALEQTESEGPVLG